MELNAVFLSLATCAGIAILLIVLAIPLLLGKVKRNGLYGFRTPKTLSSDAIWYSANREAAQNFIIAGIFIVIAAIVLFFLKTSVTPSVLVITIAAITFLSLVAVVVKSFMFLSKYK